MQRKQIFLKSVIRGGNNRDDVWTMQLINLFYSLN